MKIAVLLLLALVFFGCGDSSQTNIVGSGNVDKTDDSKLTKCEDKVTKQTDGEVIVTTVCNGEVVKVEEFASGVM